VARLGVDQRGDRVEHRRIVEIVEPTHQPSATTAPAALQVQFVDARLGPVVGLGPVGVQHLEQPATAGLQLAGRAVRDPRGKLLLRGRPPLRIEPTRGIRAEDPGDSLEVPETGNACLERGRGGGQPGRQRAAVEPDAGPDVLGRAQVPLGPGDVPNRAGRPARQRWSGSRAR
jgi:hypothetical protein